MIQPIKIAKGGFADVWDLQNGTVLKAFRSEPRAHGEVVDIQDHNLLTSVFCVQEINAYKKLENLKFVKEHIPNFYGQKDPVSVLPDYQDLYVKDAGFVIEKLNGRDQKIAHLPDEAKNNVEKVLWILSENLKELNVWDSSCFYEAGNNFKLIDFALWESSIYECHLYDYGRLTEEQKYYLNSLI